ncbi:hypothetical protein CGCVW01_v003515, partial [Colletotrichum viniferum]
KPIRPELVGLDVSLQVRAEGFLGLLCEHLVLCVHRIITSHHPCATLVLSDNPPVRHVS